MNQIADNGSLVEQPSGVPFPWPHGVTLTAVDEVVLALPGLIIDSPQTIGAALEGSDDMDIKIEFDDDRVSVKLVYIKLQPRMWARVKRSCEAVMISSDGAPKRLMVKR